MRILSTLVACLASSLAAQTGSVTLIGNACSTPGGVATIGSTGVPTIGTTFELTYAGPNAVFDGSTQTRTQPWLVVGFNLLGTVVIPPGLFPLQPAGCVLEARHTIVIPLPTPSPIACPQCTEYPDRWPIPLPNHPGLVGMTFFAQWLTVHTQCGIAGCDPGPLWLGTSETAICVVGV